MAWGDSDENRHRCKSCTEMFRRKDMPTPCRPCEFRRPDLGPQAALAFQVYAQVRGCRLGEGDYLDYQSLFQVMALHGLDDDLKAEIFSTVTAVETDWRRRMNEKREAAKNT